MSDPTINCTFLSDAGELLTNAAWIRKFVHSHPDYHYDSIVSEKVTYDLVRRLKDISEDVVPCPELLGTLVSQRSSFYGQSGASHSLWCIYILIVTGGHQLSGLHHYYHFYLVQNWLEINQEYYSTLHLIISTRTQLYPFSQGLFCAGIDLQLFIDFYCNLSKYHHIPMTESPPWLSAFINNLERLTLALASLV